MKKYKLLKDLPLAKAGAIVRLEDTPVESSIKLIFKVNKNEHPLCAIYEKELNEWLEEIKEPKNIFNLKEWDEFYCIWSSNYVYKNIWDNLDTYKKELEIWDIFLTREEAEKEVEKRKAIQKIKKYCWENGIDDNCFDCEDQWWYFIVNRYNWSVSISLLSYKNWNPIGYFSKENAEKILKLFKKELKIILE